MYLAKIRKGECLFEKKLAYTLRIRQNMPNKASKLWQAIANPTSLYEAFCLCLGQVRLVLGF